MLVTPAKLEANRRNALLAGRPKGSLEQTTYYKKETLRIITELVFKNIKPMTMAMIKEAKEGSAIAYTALMDRAVGKAVQGVELTGKDGNPIVFMPPELIAKYTFETPQEPANVNDDVVKISKPVLEGSTKP